MGLRLLPVVLLLACCAPGCTIATSVGPVSFLVVDDNSGKPMSGVSVRRDSGNRVLMGWTFFGGKPGSYEFGVTGADGIMVASGLRNNLAHAFRFRKAGYLLANAFVDSYRGEISGDRPPSDPHRRDRSGNLPLDNGRVIIRMYPEGTPEAEYTPHWRQIDDAPPAVLALAEKQVRFQAAPGKLRLPWTFPSMRRLCFTNQYGEYRILWHWEDRPGVSRSSRWVDIIPPDEVLARSSACLGLIS